MPAGDAGFATSRYDPVNALKLARISAAAYERGTKVKDQLVDLGFAANARCQPFENRATSTQAYVISDSQKIVLAFRGTEPNVLVDWLTDFGIAHQRVGDYGSVHSGFNHALTSVWRDIRDHLEDLRREAAMSPADAVVLQNAKSPRSARAQSAAAQPPNRGLWITGHSLGGALATLAAFELAVRSDNPIRGIYTYGQPRACDHMLATRLNMVTGNRYFRFVNNNDIVTRVPPRELDYSHVGSLRYIDRDSMIHEEISFWHAFLDRVAGTLDDFVKALRSLRPSVDALADHSLEAGYIASIQKLVDGLAAMAAGQPAR